jgi:UDP-N-acetylmuramyl pentapeptide phosphotransferase/UDP-N-acetylglucosamine-1-phosphate transferase
MGFVLILTSFIASLLMTGFVRQVLLNRNVLDQPNERSSHQAPVPRGGGIAMLALIIPCLIVTAIVQQSFLAHAGMLVGVLMVAVISWVDDKHSISAKDRLYVHLVAAFLGSFSLPDHAALFPAFANLGLLPFAIDRVIMIVGWAWFMNLYNFMDGIDGITGTETITLSMGICLAMIGIGFADPFLPILTMLLTGASLGFLAYNWHPAKIFLGDVGSVPLGYLTGYGLIILAAHGHFVAALILPLYYLADSGITLARRAHRGERIWQAHREHFYQKAALALGRHDRVVWRIIAANSMLILAALLSFAYPWPSLSMAVLTVALLLWNMHI